MGGRYRAPDRRMDCSPADGGIRLGPSPAVPYPRSRPRLWRGGHPAPPGPGDQRSTDIAAITLAEYLCGTADRLGPPRVRRPCCRVRRTAPSPPVARVQELLERRFMLPYLAMCLKNLVLLVRPPGLWGLVCYAPRA